MKGQGRVLLLVVLVAGLILPGGMTTEAQKAASPVLSALTGDYVPGRVLVRFKEGVMTRAAADVLAEHGASYLTHLYASPVQLVQVPEGKELALVEQLSRDPRVEYAEPDYIYRALGAPNDPYYSNQWAHTRMNSAAAWDISTGSNTVTIAVIDTGIDETHPDLAAKIVAGYDFVDDDANPHDLNGHGTHVAGIAAAITNNGVGVAGMSWGARIMPVRVLDASGSGYNSDITSGINWAYTHGAKVLNLSLGGSSPSTTMQNAVTAATNAGSLVIAAMGNCRTAGGGCPVANPTAYPAAYNNVMAVAATGPDDTYAYYSQYGSHCDIAAPGGAMTYLHDPDGIYSTLPTYDVEMTGEGFSKNYDYLQGTSMATPYVSGLAALIWSVSPGLTPAQVQQVMQDTAVDLGPTGWDVNYGYGRIDALAALQNISLSAPTLSPISNPENDGVYQVSWSAVSGATGYLLQEDNVSDFTSPTTRYSGTALQMNISGQAVGTWYYRVRATAGGTESEWSNTVSTQVLPQAPVLAPISNPSQADAYLVNWSDVSGATGYRLEQSANSAFSAVTVRYNGTASQYQVTGQPGGTWYYRVFTLVGASESGPSNTASTVVTASLLSAPTLNVIGNPDGDGAYTVTWGAVTDAMGYRLEESASPYFVQPTVVYEGPLRQYNAVDMPGGTWYYRVRATAAGGNSPWSVTRSAIVESTVFLPLVMKAYGTAPITPLLNGDFEAGQTGWAESSLKGWDLIVNTTDEPKMITPHSGTWAVWLGGDNDETATVQQSVSVPPGAPYLTYWHVISSQETLCSFDAGWVKINTITVKDYNLCVTANTGAWVKQVLDLSTYAGQTVALQFGASTDAAEVSSLFIDDVAFQSAATAAAQPSPGPFIDALPERR
ncbi:MAG: S8 family serine peptidase [Anaerolineae bacterium]|nr:S8 family serine peptidase [Anaerolineae bacterium]